MATVTPLRKDKPTARELLQGIKVIDVVVTALHLA